MSRPVWMTPLARQLTREIAASGPITVAEYMSRCLGDPQHGYYLARDPFGAAGDFVTAPEVSQIFGELIGLWAADIWLQMGRPALNLVELGPGRGTLLADALRASRTVPGFAEAIHVHLVETSPRLRSAQAAALPDVEPIWHDNSRSLPDGPVVVIANEFFDALPIHQYLRDRDGWYERRVAVDPATSGLCFQHTLACSHIGAGAAGDLIERSPARDAEMDALCHRVATAGGAALIVDYGPAKSAPGDTLQAVRAHRPVSVLQSPGESDITSHVHFEHLAARANAAAIDVHGPVTQRHFLLHLGAVQRTAALKRNATPSQLEAIDAAIHRLIAPDQMGTLFKALAVTSTGLTPGGFATFEGLPCT